MNDLEEEEDGAESLISSCVSMKSDQSKNDPPYFSNELGPSGTNVTGLPLRLQKMNDLEEEEDGAESLISSSVSMKSDRPMFMGKSCMQRKENLYQLWTLVLQTMYHLILGPVCFITRLLLSPVWRKIQNKTWTADRQSDQH
eukprot:superscaffoldBa00002608_g14781